MTRAGEIRLLEAGHLRSARAAQMLPGYLSCTVTPCPGRPGSVEATGLPGTQVLAGAPEENAAEGRRP